MYDPGIASLSRSEEHRGSADATESGDGGSIPG